MSTSSARTSSIEAANRYPSSPTNITWVTGASGRSDGSMIAR